MPESPEYFDNITLTQYAATGVPLKVYVNGRYYMITDVEDLEDPRFGYGMKPNGEMEPFNYHEIEHLNVSGNIVDIETYKKAMDDESKAAAKAKEESGDEEKDAESGDKEKDAEGGDKEEDSGNPFESFKRKGKLMNKKRRAIFEMTKDEFKAEEDSLKSKIESGKAKIDAAKKKLSDLKKQPIEDGVINEPEPHEYDSISEPYSIKVGDMVRNTNTSCKHYGSRGMVKQIIDMPDDIGQLIKYVVMNQGSTFKPGMILTKTLDQLESIK